MTITFAPFHQWMCPRVLGTALFGVAMLPAHATPVEPLPLTTRASGCRPGDIVTWELPGGLPHIGIVADTTAADGTPLVIHHIGAGARMENVSFAYEIVGHYQYRTVQP